MAGEDKTKTTTPEEEWDNPEDVTEEENEDEGGKAKQAGAGGANKGFTQDQVNKMMTREKAQGRNAALRELGIDPKDTKAVERFKALIASQKTDEEVASEKALELQTQQAAAEHRALVAEAKVEALKQGVKAQFVDDIVTLAMGKIDDDKDFTNVVGEFKTKYPTWFGEEEDGDDDADKDAKDGNKAKQSAKATDKAKGKEKDAGKKGTGSSLKSAGTDGEDKEQSLGARLAAQRKAGRTESSYWGKAKRS